MSELALHISGISKRYRLGARGTADLRELISGTAARLFRGKSGGTNGSSNGSVNGHADRPPVNEFWALHDITFDVNCGEVIGLIGRNGAGKSTLLKILARITDPTDGIAEIYGRVGSLLEVGTGFHPELTGRENVYLNGTILGMRRSEIKAKFDEIVAFSEVEKFLDTPVKRYSSGMYVRLAFAVAAHLDPEVLIVDEVLAVGDSAFQARCLAKMRDVASSGRTVLLVSHNMASIESLCSRVVALDGGRVGFDGDPAEGIQWYLNANGGSEEAGVYVRGPHAKPPKDQAAWIADARIFSNGEYNAGGYRPGEPLEFVINCETQENLTIPGMAIGIDNSYGHRIVTFHTRLDEKFHDAKVTPGRLTFRCTVNDLALAPGLYRVKLDFENARGHTDVLEPAMTFRILESDYYGTGGRRYAGVILHRQQWTLDSSNAVVNG